MQKALKEDEELAVHFQNGADAMRVLEIFLPTPRVAVLSGADQGGIGAGDRARGDFAAGGQGAESQARPSRTASR